jgi:hypothetical protein
MSTIAWEQSLIGSILINPREFDQAVHLLPSDFIQPHMGWGRNNAQPGRLDLAPDQLLKKLDKEVYDPRDQNNRRSLFA